ncbi:acyl-CoA thioesterase [Ophiocordyceps camponoti-floridani]|uniref:Acyl-CoA thioesterase n=1 Tax=Ophiocordyceps camponoti-floridani TaxID=2030778 RepID=A0A8H4VEX1_9HYPO|nr:acyl-CoA thioesterase [Ophiocordyceps camponoti-floridani]
MTDKRLGFGEALALTRMPASGSIRRFASQQPAWKPGDRLPWKTIPRSLQHLSIGQEKTGSYGGHVFAQAALAAARTVEVEQGEHGEHGSLSIHTIQGVFSGRGRIDRPYVYDVSPLYSGKSFATMLVNSRQPKQPSEKPQCPFPTPDAHVALDQVCFSCITTLKRRVPTVIDLQQSPSVQERFADILTSMTPDQWQPSPQLDMDAVNDLFKDAGLGDFPVLEMRKVDMKAFNHGKPVFERVELIYYRPLERLPPGDVNVHIVCHAYGADRNGLLMLANHIELGQNIKRIASLSFSFYVHVNAEEALMDDDGWWLQEVRWPRVSANRCMMESKLWSPGGKHVATAYQDGIVAPIEGEPLETRTRVLAKSRM